MPNNSNEADNRGGLDLRTMLLLVTGGGATYVAFLHPGVAMLVGVGVMTLLHLLLK